MLRDLFIAKNPEEPYTRADAEDWESILCQVFLETAESSAAAGSGQTAKSGPQGPVSKAKKAMRGYLQALDHILKVAFERSLAQLVAPRIPVSPSLNPAQQQTLVLFQDEGPVGFALKWYLEYQAHLRLLVFRDPLHREWNDAGLAIKAVGAWWAVALSTIIFNLAYGPWESEAWFQKAKEGAEAYFAKIRPSDILFNELYGPICSDRGEDPRGTLVHKQSLLKELSKSRLFFSRGEKVALRRWFSWHKAVAENLQTWHLRLCTLMALGIEIGAYKKKVDLPYFRPLTFKPEKPQESDQVAKDVVEAAAAGSAASSSSAAPPPVEDKGGVKKPDAVVQKLRAKCRNTLFLAVEALARPGFYFLVKRLFLLSRPFYNAHADTAKTLRGPAAAKSWYLAQAQGQWREALNSCLLLLEDSNTLEDVGLEVTFDPGLAKNTKVEDPLVVTQDAIAQDCWNLVLNLLAKRVASMSWHTEYYPGRFALLLSPLPQEVTGFLKTLASDYEAFQKLSETKKPSRFVQALQAGSPFNTAWVRELAFLLCDPKAGVDKETAVCWAKAAVGQVFSTFGGTKVVEDNFHQLRLKESKPGVQKRKLPLNKQLQTAQTAGTLTEHGWAELELSGEGTDATWDNDWCYPAKHVPSLDTSPLEAAAAKWPSYTPQSSLGLVGLLHLLRTENAKGPLNQDRLATVWKGSLLPAGTVFQEGKSKDFWVSLGTIGTGLVRAWKLEQRKTGNKTFLFLKPATAGLDEVLRWVHVFDWDNFSVTPTEAWSPFHSFLATKGKGFAEVGGMALCPTGNSLPLLHHACLKAFWKLPKTTLEKVRRAQGAKVAAGTTLVALLKGIIQAAMPALSLQRIAEILSQRLLHMDASAGLDVPAELLEDALPDARDQKEIQDRMCCV